MTDLLEQKLNAYFDKLIFSLNERRNILLTELKKRQQLELSKREEHQDVVLAITGFRERITARPPLNRLLTFEDKMVSQFDQKLEQVETSFSPIRFNFEINPNEIEFSIASLGVIVEDMSFDYSTFQQPVLAVGGQGNRFDCPHAIAYDKTNKHIYVTNYMNAFLTVFSISGHFIGQTQLYNSTGIYGIAIHEDNMYITGFQTHCVMHYNIPGPHLVRKVGSKGFGRNEFNTPTHLTVDTNGDVYVAESGNHRIHVMNSKLCHKWFIKHDALVNPCDVKISDSSLFVLTNSNPCLHVFTMTGQKIRSLISRGPNMQIENSLFFCLDKDMNILMTDTLLTRLKCLVPMGTLNTS